MDRVLNKLWKNFGNFPKFPNFGQLFQLLKEEVELFDGKCFDDDSDCMKNADKIKRSVYALLSYARKPPKTPGLYLAYHMSRIFSDNSYIQESMAWPWSPFGKEPDKLILSFDKYLRNFVKIIKHYGGSQFIFP